MTMDERAARIAKLVVSANAIPFAVAGTDYHQQRVIEDATATVKSELESFLREDVQSLPKER